MDISPRARAVHRQGGAVLIGFLLLLAASGWTVADWSQRASDQRLREDEAELLWVGMQYQAAIESYYNGTPAGLRQLPSRLEDLIEDKRFPKPRRHLRRAYLDPLRPGQPMQMITRGDRIVGVRSTAGSTPFRRTGFDPGLEHFGEAASHADWRFMARLGAAPVQPRAGVTTPVQGLPSPGTGAPASPR